MSRPELDDATKNSQCSRNEDTNINGQQRPESDQPATSKNNTPSTTTLRGNLRAENTTDDTGTDQQDHQPRPTRLSLEAASPSSHTIRRGSFYEEEDETNTINNSESVKEKPVSWRALPKKGQLIVLTVARLAEPLAMTSLQAYVFHQVRSFDPSLPDSTVSEQAGVLQGCFTAAQFATAVFWGRLADTTLFGRKRVLLIGLLGATVATIGFGFSRSFTAAVIFRTLGGALNSNVGVMRTMIAEIIEEKKYQSRAFLILPMCFNVGLIFGPILGGILANPVKNYPGIFGPGSLFGGEDGVWWMRRWPYALPNIVSAYFMLVSFIAVFLGLDETHEIAKERLDRGRQLWTRIAKHSSSYRYRPVAEEFDGGRAGSFDLEPSHQPSSSATHRERLPFRQIWTRNLLLTLLTHFMLAIHTSAFNALCFIFLPAPRAPNSRTDFFHFGGGLGMSSSRVGLATAIIGILGLPLQIFLYPRWQFSLGTLTTFRLFLPLSPLAYILAPFLVLVPNIPYILWPLLSAVIFLQVVSRTFAVPATVILVNNAVPDPSVLATVHGVAQSVSSGARAVGPLIAGWGLGLGLKHNIVGAIWWALAVQAILNLALTWTIFEGKDEDRDENRSRHTTEDEEPSGRSNAI